MIKSRLYYYYVLNYETNNIVNCKKRSIILKFETKLRIKYGIESYRT